MPLIPYKCNECDYVGETLVGSGESPAECDDCGGKDLARVWSGFTVSGRTESKIPDSNPRDASPEPGFYAGVGYCSVRDCQVIGLARVAPSGSIDTRVVHIEINPEKSNPEKKKRETLH
ncbi:MAG TPA: FmdB family zinc ribbon protein [Candidatus Nanoarchaeia archaeon]|nr:FmdB family zinc ribbon protein [Candidatus Nanoarchaeia archaeon]